MHTSEIDWTELKDRISKDLKIVFDLEIKVSRDNKVLFIGNDISDKTGILSVLFRDVRLTCSDSTYFPEEQILAVTISFRWSYKGSGYNGRDFLNAWYNFKTKSWEFQEM